MSDLGELYQELIVDHSRSPRNFRELPDANRKAAGSNPLCGDQITVYLKVENDVIKEIGFQGSGCAISKASASLMTGSIRDKPRTEVQTLFEKFHQMVTGSPNGKVNPVELGKLAVFQGVSEFPVRVKCATLAWHTLLAALDGKGETTI